MSVELCNELKLSIMKDNYLFCCFLVVKNKEMNIVLLSDQTVGCLLSHLHVEHLTCCLPCLVSLLELRS